MKICVIVRGHCVREGNPHRKYVDSLICWPNWKTTFCNMDFVFITYPSSIINQIKETIQPVHIELHQPITQIENFADVLAFMDNNRNNYDRFVIIRSDITYKKSADQWPNWDKNGIILTNKDVHWPSKKLYGDTVFIVDSPMIDIFSEAFYSNIYGETLHGIGQYLYENNVPFYLMYEEYYHMNKHPLHWLASLEPTDYCSPVMDVSQWN